MFANILYTFNNSIFLLIIIFIILYFIFSYFFGSNLKTINSNYDYAKCSKLIPKNVCQNIINEAKQTEWDFDKEPVDGDPVVQIDIYHDENDDLYENNKKLWKHIEPYYKEIEKQLDNSNFKWLPKKYYLESAFIKRYQPQERTHLILHSDNNCFTANILLSDTNDFSDGGLYLFDRSQSLVLEGADELLGTKGKNDFIDNYPHLHIANFNQGDMLVHPGYAYHGTLPVTEGMRYTIIFFFAKSTS